MDARQRADDALEALTALRGPLADVMHEMGREDHAALAKVEAFAEGALADLEAELRKVAAGHTPDEVPEDGEVAESPDPAPPATGKAP
jgi:hypothetical protein